ncbi:MAG TPA: hypothetical protein VGI99_02490 [Gemmataceae bacterium]
MNAILRSAAAVVLFLGAAPASAADPIRPASPAELFPPGTVAYAEIHDPALVGPQIAAAFKGSVLEDSIKFIHARRDKTKNPRDITGKGQLAVLGLIASPEMAAEFKKLRGLAIGVVGINEQGLPEVAAAVLTGDSAAAGLAARALLTMTSVRKVGTVGDVPVYQYRQPAMSYDPNGQPTIQNDKPPAEGTHEATFAYLPGLFVVGSNKASVGQLIRRYEGKLKGSLATDTSFKEAAVSRRPGLFFYVNPSELIGLMDGARKKGPGIGEAEPDALGWFKVLVNAKAIRYAAGTASFRDGGLDLSLTAAFDPAHKSPLFEFLTGPGIKLEMLRNAPAPASLACTVTFPEANRPQAVLGFLDALAKANGILGRLPSDVVKELEAKEKRSVADRLIGKTVAATVVFPVHQDLPRGAEAMPLVVLRAQDAETAAAWEDFLPKLIGDLAKTDPPQATSEFIGGLKVISLPAGTLPWKAAVHCARKERVIAIGLDRKLVAAAANGSATPLAVLPAGEAPVLAGTVGLGGLIRIATEVKRVTGPVVPRGKPTPATVQPGFGGFGGFPGGPGGIVEEDSTIAGGRPVPAGSPKNAAKAWDALLKAFDGLPPATIAARRTGLQLRIDLWQPKVQGGGIAPLVNAGIDWIDHRLNSQPNPNGGPYPYGGAFFK